MKDLKLKNSLKKLQEEINKLERRVCELEAVIKKTEARLKAGIRRIGKRADGMANLRVQ